MSKPIRAADGCIIATSGNTYDTIPFWLLKGKVHIERIDGGQCPTKTHHRDKTYTEILTPFAKRHIGFLESFKETGSTWISVIKHEDKWLFIGKDVYCKECGEWHFKI